MKNLKDILEEQNFLVNKKLNNRQDKYEYHPTTKGELQDIIINLLQKGQTNLNCIDVSKITDMGGVFYTVNNKVKVKEIDISEWDVSNVEDMRAMFYECTEFTANMSNWNVSNVERMGSMFYKCEKFNSDLSKWDVSNNVYIDWMFTGCVTLEKNNKIPAWYSN